MSSKPFSHAHHAWSSWLDDHRPKQKFRQGNQAWLHERFAADAKHFATGNTIRLTDKRASSVSKGRRTTVARHAFNADGTEYRAYLTAREKNAGKDLLFVRALAAISDVGLTQSDVLDLIQHTVGGPRQRRIRLVERKGGVMQMIIDHQSPAQGWVRLGHVNGRMTGPRIALGDSEALFVQVAEFAAIEAKLESGEEVDPDERRRMVRSGQLRDLHAEGPW